MRVDQAQFMEQGYLILRNVIPAEQLDAIRRSYEVLVERQKAVWARERQPDDPPGGVWETHQQPRLSHVEELVDRSTANAVELWLHESTLGVAQQLIRAPELAVTEMMLMCNPVHDHPGGTGWHRDFQPATQAPVEGLTEDLRANGPGYVQWNIPLYDDNVLWVVPGSHLRVNTEAEERQMAEDPQAPLPGGIPVPLNAGDGVVYTNLIWHWGSNYSTRLRRTIHGGHASIAPPPLRPYILAGVGPAAALCRVPARRDAADVGKDGAAAQRPARSAGVAVPGNAGQGRRPLSAGAGRTAAR